MKKILTLMVVMMAVSSASIFAQSVEDVLGVKKVTFNGVKYQLGWSAHNSKQYLQEYYPKGQSPESFTDMFSIDVHKRSDVSPQVAVAAKVVELQQRKEKQKDVWNWATCESPDGSECIIDFICCKGTEDALDMVEFDVHKYKIIQVDGQPALQLLFYTHRAYGDDIMPFMKEKLAGLRQETIKALISFSVDCKIKTGVARP